MSNLKHCHDCHIDVNNIYHEVPSREVEDQTDIICYDCYLRRGSVIDEVTETTDSMRWVKFVMTKHGQLRAYKYNRGQMRWFPFPLVEAQQAVLDGDALDVTATC